MATTPAGKAISAQNARTHGLSAATLVFDNDDQRAEFDGLQANLQNELTPSGALEEEIFRQLLHAAWNLRRIQAIQASVESADPNALLDPKQGATLDRLARYETRHNRAFYRAINELRKLQNERGIREAQPAEATSHIPALARSAEITKRTAPPTIEEAWQQAFAAMERETMTMHANAYMKRHRAEQAEAELNGMSQAEMNDPLLDALAKIGSSPQSSSDEANQSGQ